LPVKKHVPLALPEGVIVERCCGLCRAPDLAMPDAVVSAGAGGPRRGAAPLGRGGCGISPQNRRALGVRRDGLALVCLAPRIGFSGGRQDGNMFNPAQTRSDQAVLALAEANVRTVSPSGH